MYSLGTIISHNDFVNTIEWGRAGGVQTLSPVQLILQYRFNIELLIGSTLSKTMIEGGGWTFPWVLVL